MTTTINETQTDENVASTARANETSEEKFVRQVKAALSQPAALAKLSDGDREALRTALDPGQDRKIARIALDHYHVARLDVAREEACGAAENYPEIRDALTPQERKMLNHAPFTGIVDPRDRQVAWAAYVRVGDLAHQARNAALEAERQQWVGNFGGHIKELNNPLALDGKGAAVHRLQVALTRAKLYVTAAELNKKFSQISDQVFDGASVLARDVITTPMNILGGAFDDHRGARLRDELAGIAATVA